MTLPTARAAASAQRRRARLRPRAARRALRRRRAPRRPRRSAARCAASWAPAWAAGPDRALWALPPRSAKRDALRLRRRRPTLSRHGRASAYELFRRARSSWRPATTTPRPSRCPRARARRPTRTSVREALGRALFLAPLREAAEEFEAVVEHAPTNDYALFCLGPRAAAARPRRRGAQAAGARRALRPERGDYKKYRDQARRKAA